MFLRMLFVLLQEYFATRFAAIIDMPARLFLTYQAGLALCLLTVINTGMVFSPICKISLIADTSFCAFVNDARSYSLASSLPYAPFFNAQSEVLGGAVEGTNLVESASLDFTQTHIAVDDLILAVQHTDISRKEELARTLERLRGDTRSAGRQLKAFASSFSGSVER